MIILELLRNAGEGNVASTEENLKQLPLQWADGHGYTLSPLRS